MSAPNSRGTVLVVDDDVIVADVYRIALELEGWRVRVAMDGQDGLATAATIPDLAMVVTDLALPGAVDGVALAQTLQRERPTLPVLVTSGWVSEEQQQSLEQAGVVDTLQKPVSLGTLADAVNAAVVPQVPTDADGSRVRVLVADDDPSVRAMVSRELHDAGYAPVEACDGAEAFDRVLARRVEAAFIDLRMPRLDGIGGIGALRQLDPGLTVIVITADADDTDLVRRALAAGAMACLAKPLDLAAIRRNAEAAVLMTQQRREITTAHAGWAGTRSTEKVA